jgi:hypothetical protein
MTALSVFTDLHNINLLLYKSPDEYWFENFPYVYSKSVYSASFSEEEFYTEIFDNFCSAHGVKLTDCEVLMTGFLESPRLGSDARSDFSKKVNVKLTKSLYEIISAITGYNLILINNHSILTKDGCLSNTTVRPLRKPGELLDVEEENYYANLELYPQIIANDLTTQIDLDSNIAALLKPEFKLTPDLPIVFGGSRFAQKSMFNELDHLLMLNFIKGTGIYDVYLDKNNALVLFTLLKMYAPDVKVTPDILHEETVVSSTGTIESVIQTHEGTSQLVHIDKNRLLVIPSAKGENLKVKIKARDLGEFEKVFEGANLGLVYDTRETKTISAQDIKSFTLGLKNFKTANFGK